MTKEYKKLTYAYFSSPHAEKYNHGQDCWLVTWPSGRVTVFRGDQRWLALSCFESIHALPDPVSSFTRESLPFREQHL